MAGLNRNSIEIGQAQILLSRNLKPTHAQYLVRLRDEIAWAKVKVPMNYGTLPARFARNVLSEDGNGTLIPKTNLCASTRGSDA